MDTIKPHCNSTQQPTQLTRQHKCVLFTIHGILTSGVAMQVA